MNDASNADQVEFWSGPSGQNWVTHEAGQDHLLQSVADLVLARAGLNEGDRVVDIGCGTGALSLGCAAAVGVRGHVLATDISTPMLARAAERLAPFPQAETRNADAQVADWPGEAFDHAVSRFGVMFFADPPTAFANIARGLKSGGRMTFAAWAPASDNPFWELPQRIASGILGKPPRVEPNTPGPMGLADRDLTVQRFEAAGLSDVICTPEAVDLVFDHGAAELARLMTKVGPGARIINLFEASEVQVAQVADNIAVALASYDHGGQVRLPAMINLIEVRVP